MAYLTNTVKNETGKEISIQDAYKLKDYELEGDTYQANSMLPDGYTQVEYIESSGTQYIDTGYKFVTNDIIDISFLPLETGVDKALFGVYEAGGKVCELGLLYGYLRGNVGSNGPSYNTTTIYDVQLRNGQWSYNGTGFGITYNTSTTKNCLLFSRDYNGIADKRAKIRFYDLKITRNNNIVYHFIPCYRNSDNEIGVYEIVNGVFSSNLGTGTFTKGENVDELQEIQLVEGEQTIIEETKNKMDLNKIEETSNFEKTSTGVIISNAWASQFMTNSNLMKTLKPNTKYTCRTIAQIKERPEQITQTQQTLAIYRAQSTTYGNTIFVPIVGITNMATAPLNTDIECIKIFTTPADLNGCSILAYNYYSSGGKGKYELRDLMIVEGEYTSSNFPTFDLYNHKEYVVNLGKNYFDISKVITSQTNRLVNNEDGTLTSNAPSGSSAVTGSSPNKLKDYCPYLKVGDNVILNATTTGSDKFIYLYGSNILWNFGYARVITETDLNSQVYWYASGVNTSATISQIMVRKVGTTDEYRPYIEPIRLARIGYLKDAINKSKGNNIWNEEWELGNINNTTGELENATNYVRSKIIIKVNPNTTYYIPSNTSFPDTGRIFFYTQQIEYISNVVVSKNGGTFTTPSNCYYIRFKFYGTTYKNDVAILEGATGTYEPYGKVWYVAEKIGKTILNGSENWVAYDQTSYSEGSWTYYTNNPAIKKDFTNLYCMSNNFKYTSAVGVVPIKKFTIGGQITSKNGNIIVNPFGDTTNKLADFKTWLGTHNLEVLFPLEIPTYTKITNQELIDQLNAIELLEGVNEITVDSVNLPATLNINYYSTDNPYQDAVYSQDDKNDLKIYFNDVELEDAGRYCEKITRIARIIPNDGKKRFSLDNFISTSVEVILHNVDVEDIVDQVRIEIGTDVGNNTYQYIPLGIFNIQDIPEKDGNKITLKLRDNRVKFDFNYNAQPLIESLGGIATKKQILDDICEKAGVENTILSFNGDTDNVAIYDSTITGTTYVSYILEQAGLIPTIDRQGRLIAIDLSNLYTWKIPLSLIESYELGEPYKIERVVYESGIIKYETSDDETLDTLYLNSANPYIFDNSQVTYILDKLKNFEIDSVETKRVLGNPAIDPYDLIEIYNDLDGTNDVVFKTLANTTYTFNGVHRDTFDTQIGKEQRTENVSKNSEEAFQRYARTSIDNLSAEINLVSSETKQYQVTNDEAISQLATRTNTVEQRITSTETNIEVIEQQMIDGQKTFKNNLVTIDINGINVSTNVSAIATLITNEKFVIRSGDRYLAYFGYDEETNSTKAEMDNLTVTNYFIAGYHRVEKMTIDGEHRTGYFYIG